MVAANPLPYMVEFSSVLEMSMANWRDEMEHLGLDLRDGVRSLLDLGFANENSIFGTS